MSSERVGAELVAVLTAVSEGRPLVLVADGGRRLPSGPLRTEHRSMQAGLHAWVAQQTGHHLGYVEQLYTFADRDRSPGGGRVVSVSYLGLTRAPAKADAGWRDWYSFFPWEDRRPGAGGAALVGGTIGPLLRGWAARAATAGGRERRVLRTEVCFALDGRPWSPELVLQRYELLYEAGLIAEAAADVDVGDDGAGGGDGAAPAGQVPGERMAGDHRRILSTGLARLRAKIQYHPVVFELVPDTFTLGQLQSAVEAIAGQALHTQNFRRLVTQQNLVEPTGGTDSDTGGRPARLYRFRREVLDERGVAGTKLPRTR